MGMSKLHEAVHMALSADEIAGHPGLHAAIRQQSRLLLQIYDGNPRLASVFGTQHRWLMAQSALALHFRSVRNGRGISSAQILDFVSRHGVASRNTADAFIKEMLKYGFARLLPGAADKRTRPFEPTEASLDALHGWVGIHLATLDRLDSGQRLETFLGTPGALAVLAAEDRRRAAFVEPRAPAGADLLAVHLAEQRRPGHGLADRRHRGGRRSTPSAWRRESCRSPPWLNG